jgi:hypothetical protein
MLFNYFVNNNPVFSGFICAKKSWLFDYVWEIMWDRSHHCRLIPVVAGEDPRDYSIKFRNTQVKGVIACSSIEENKIFC